MDTEVVKIALVLEYDGTNYCGFQFQTNAPSIQNEIEKAVVQLTGEKTRVVGASRTDTGVHAKGQVVSFRTGSKLSQAVFKKGLNHYLPPDIAVKAVYQINSWFNIQSQAISRQYQYYIDNGEVGSPLTRGYAHHVKWGLKIEAMNEAAALLVGQHDMTSFVTDFSQSRIKSSIRKVFSAQFERRENTIIFDILAQSFLPHQVRNTVGALIRVGLGKMSVSQFETLMEAKKPGLAGPTVPARGLFLMQINYPRPLGEYDENL